MLKRMLVFMTVALSLLVASPAFAEPQMIIGQDSISPEKKAEILKLFEQMSDLDLQRISASQTVQSKIAVDSKNTVSSQSLNLQKIELEDQLGTLGVRKLSPTEGQQLINAEQSKASNNNIVTPYITVPSDTSNVDFYELNYTHTRGSKTWDIQEVYARGTNIGTALYRSEAAFTIVSGTSVSTTNLASPILKVYAEKIIGAVIEKIPYADLLPYELFTGIPSGASSVTMNGEYLNYSELTTVCFTYVKDHSTSGPIDTLSYVSSMFEISSIHHSTGIANAGTPNAKTLTSASLARTEYIYATDYAVASKAVDAFLNFKKATSYASGYIVQAVTNPSISKRIPIATPAFIGVWNVYS
ncbi:hypothetical protein [Cohnella sp. GCM10027633]|uniref:hypothetical protein n=1 Tax=unclassified Cohnella TaxID=2636738 RepID=UPI003637B9AF